MDSTIRKIEKLEEMTSHDLDFQDSRLTLLHILKKLLQLKKWF